MTPGTGTRPFDQAQDRQQATSNKGGTERELTLLRRVARLYGVQAAYAGMEHERFAASPESLRAVLHSLGAPVEGDLSRAVIEKQRELWHWRLDPVTVAWHPHPPAPSPRGRGGVGETGRIRGTVGQRDRWASAVLRVPASATGRVEWRLALEDGMERRGVASLEELREGARQTVEGEAYVERLITLPDWLPLGYHRLEVDVAGRRLRGHVIAAPVKAYDGRVTRSWGVFLPLYALRTGRSRDVADYRDLDALDGWAAGRGASVVATLPLLPVFLDRPFDPSPYAPVSRLFWNELYVEEGTRNKEQGTGFGADGHVEANGGELVDYRAAMRRKRRALEEESRNLSAQDEANLAAFLKAKPEVEDYGRFRAAVERLGHNWRAWPEPARRGDLKSSDYDVDVAGYYAYAQWRAHEQLDAASARAREEDVELYLDLPVGVNSDGYDAWRYQELFVSGASVGAPPDIVTNSGQDWGFAPLHPEKLRESGYEYVRRYLAHHFNAAGVLRLDHAMGLMRLYWVPHGMTARDGVYVRYNAEEQFAVLCLESCRAQAAVVGENLGIVPDAVNAGLARHGIGRMYVMSIELTGEAAQPFRRIPRDVVASFGTHDLPLFAAFWQESDIEERVRLGVLDRARAVVEREQRQKQKQALITYLRTRGLIDPHPSPLPARERGSEVIKGLSSESDAAEEVLKGVMAVLAQSAARRVLVNLEDLWLETRPQNVPGTMGDRHPNWQRRARYALEELDTVQLLNEVVELLRRERPREPADD